MQPHFESINQLIQTELQPRTEVDLYLCTVVLLELGKLSKVKLLKSGRVSLFDFCSEGFDLWVQNRKALVNLDFDYEEIGQIIKYCDILNTFRNNGV